MHLFLKSSFNTKSMWLCKTKWKNYRMSTLFSQKHLTKSFFKPEALISINFHLMTSDSHGSGKAKCDSKVCSPLLCFQFPANNHAASCQVLMLGTNQGPSLNMHLPFPEHRNQHLEDCAGEFNFSNHLIKVNSYVQPTQLSVFLMLIFMLVRDHKGKSVPT